MKRVLFYFSLVVLPFYQAFAIPYLSAYIQQLASRTFTLALYVVADLLYFVTGALVSVIIILWNSYRKEKAVPAILIVLAVGILASVALLYGGIPVVVIWISKAIPSFGLIFVTYIVLFFNAIRARKATA